MATIHEELVCFRPHSGKSTGSLGLCVHATSTQDEFPGSVRADAASAASEISVCQKGVVLPDSVRLHNDSASLSQLSSPQSLRADQLRYPRTNTALEEVLAVAAMLALFSAGMLLPWILLGCVLATTLCRNIPAMLFLAATALDCCLPAGKVTLSSHLKASYYKLSLYPTLYLRWTTHGMMNNRPHDLKAETFRNEVPVCTLFCKASLHSNLDVLEGAQPLPSFHDTL